MMSVLNKMNYSALNIIHSTPQDTRLTEANHLSRAIAKDLQRTTTTDDDDDRQSMDVSGKYVKSADTKITKIDLAAKIRQIIRNNNNTGNYKLMNGNQSSRNFNTKDKTNSNSNNGEDDLSSDSLYHQQQQNQQETQQLSQQQIKMQYANGHSNNYINNNNNNNTSIINNNNIIGTNLNGVISDKCSDMKNATKQHLNFSVDRLLGMDNIIHQNNDINNHLNRSSILCNKSAYTVDRCQDSAGRIGYNCCPYTNGGRPLFAGFPYAILNGPTPTAAMDTNAIVRPTPIRVTNRVNAVFGGGHMGGHFKSPQAIVNYRPQLSNSLHSSVSNLSQLKAQQLSLTRQAYRQSGAQSEANSTTSGVVSTTSKRKRSWSRAVFSNLQRKGLEIQFQVQKYITKPDRRKLAARLNLTDAQVKVWFQNRRMKWRHTRENLRSGQEKTSDSYPKREMESHTSSDEDEIDVVAE